MVTLLFFASANVLRYSSTGSQVLLTCPKGTEPPENSAATLLAYSFPNGSGEVMFVKGLGSPIGTVL
ncbi:hypothetical protein IG631_10912 [Alternaria alternata]|nr:hypothetical protein IG631_10912 [Alternaria alternata]